MTAERIIIETLFRIPDKEGRDVDFKLNEVQAKLDSELSLRNVVPKARQRGISAYVVALFTARCLAYRNRRALILSHTGEATTRLLDRAHYYLDNIKGAKADLKFNSRNEIGFTKTGSALYIGTAGSSSVGVGDTITDFHGSEVAFWTNPQELLKGVFNAVPPTGTIILESTGKGMGNFYHRTCMRAAEGQGPYKLHFFSWLDAAEYSKDLSDEEAAAFVAGLDPELEEPQLFGTLTVPQLAWRREKLEEMDYDLPGFKEQFPITLDECFQATGGAFFHRVNYRPDAAWHKHPDIDHLWIYGDHPKPGLSYVGGADTGGGVGRDNSVLEIFCVEEMRQVAEWVSNRFEPHIFAQKIKPILEWFNKTYLNLERNNHGILTIKELLDLKYEGRLHMSRPPRNEIEEYGKIADYGTFTSVKNRLDILGSFRALVAEELVIHSPTLKNEMDSFVETDTGKFEAQEGCFDDRVLACSFATYVLPRAAVRARETKRNAALDPFSLDSILAELGTKYDQEFHQ